MMIAVNVWLGAARCTPIGLCRTAPIVCAASAPLNTFALASRSMRVERNWQKSPELRLRQAGYVTRRTFAGTQVG
jgi:hypothetical protein